MKTLGRAVYVFDGKRFRGRLIEAYEGTFLFLVRRRRMKKAKRLKKSVKK